MTFKIYITGEKLKPHFIASIKEYEKRLSRYCKIDLLFFKKPSQLLSKIPPNSHIILISSSGVTISSEELSSKIDMLGLTGMSTICIIIGEESIKYHETIALSSMEMELGLTTTILYEQIYRAYRILNNQAYHK